MRRFSITGSETLKGPGTRRLSTGSEVIASTAGEDSWRSWAGRSHGSEGFEFFDAFRFVNRKFKATFLWGVPPSGTPCPVCYTVPESKDEWHVTSACGHATCTDCFQQYAASLVRDPEHHGPLKCPVCPLPLRPADALRSLAGHPELVEIWDAKIRDQLLRALPGYRSCPHCNGNNKNNALNNTYSSKAGSENNDNSQYSKPFSLVGGGFVTPECLAPINKRREKIALAWLDHPFMSQMSRMALYCLYVYCYHARAHSTSIYVDIVNATIVPFWATHRLWLLGRRLFAGQARRALFEPITVECPCCNKAFILSAESELGNNIIADEATQEWIGSNTRPCPSCSVPISKADGCNHMVCTSCRAKFCWACMRLGSACASYSCRNGAPFGNAETSRDRSAEGQEPEGGILGRIDRIENESTNLDRRDVLLFWAIAFGIYGRDSQVIQFTAKAAVTLFALVFSSGTMFFCLLVILLSTMVRKNNRRVNIRSLVNGDAAAGIAGELFNVDNAVERRMVAEAIRRSLVEQ